jgi:hypothetical protein
MNIDMRKTIDNAIKEIWCNNIKYDYENFSLLKEDTLKNSFYFHLRNKLTDRFLEENRLKIYTEYYHDGLRADLAIAQLCEEPGLNGHLRNDVVDILAVVEMKYKYDTNDDPFKKDIVKVKNYIKNLNYINCLYYLAFIHEVINPEREYSWLTQRDRKWANGKVTELNGYFIEGNDEPVFQIISY